MTTPEAETTQVEETQIPLPVATMLVVETTQEAMLTHLVAETTLAQKAETMPPQTQVEMLAPRVVQTQVLKVGTTPLANPRQNHQ